ncbi:restriction endonuclease subunit S [Dictyobacter formicarum]|uniref:Type I restriction system specificity protein n=1 Tax=Dictyobacter formicarum TaxID=2778368 RepID=A0ABQ3VAS8_9CHLR|nr:restriction endonuclease subunit S [Dictyobacter formicarum]GHO82987.1 type I restriction system specificity protein [Dictyobacter formicarum]
MTEWEETTLGKICEDSGGNIQTGPFGSQLHASDYVSVGVPSIMPQNISDNRVIIDGIARIRDADARRLSRYLVKSGDIVYSRRGDVERRALIRETEEGWLCGTGCLRVRFGDKKPISSTFISYYLGVPNIRKWIVQHAVGATMPNLNTAILSDVPVRLPPYHEQKAIADVLSAFDDKIELNRQMNNTLESIVQALFKSWFMDFDPVKAKAEGQKPEGMDEATAALFPSDFTKSILGPIPEGWTISEIGKEVEVIGGSTPSTQEAAYWEDGNLCWATPKDLSKLKSPILLNTERKITELGVKQIPSGQLPINTVLLSSRAPVGYIALAKVPTSINQGFIAIKCIKDVSPYFVINWAYHKLDEIKARATGTTFAEISKSVFRPIKVIVPSKAIIQRFDDIAKPIYERITENERNVSSLTNARDLLLPLLISGKLRISDLPEEDDVS